MARDMADEFDESKTCVPAVHKRWIALCTDVREHEVVGMQIEPPQPYQPDRRAWSHFELWVWMLCEAERADKKRKLQGRHVHLSRGQLVLPLRYLRKVANWNLKAIRRFLERLRKHGMVSLSVTPGTQLPLDFAGSSLSDVCPERGTGVTIVTLCNYEAYQHAPSRRGTRGAQEGHARGTAGAHTPTVNKDTKDKEKEDSRGDRKRGSRLPTDWTLPVEWRQWAEINFSTDADRITEEADKFRDHWIAKPGRAGCKLDWLATWRNWLRNARGKPATVIQYRSRDDRTGKRLLADIDADIEAARLSA